MNHTYRSIWSDKRQTFVATSEITMSAGRKSSPRTGRVAAASRFAAPALAAGCLLLFAAGAPAELPTGGTVSAGNATITTGTSTLTVNQASQNVAINWQAFNIGLGESVTFNQPNASAIALNRVLGPDPSSILGSLFANGRVFLVNPNGVLFGKGASVNVGGIVASTLDLSDADFMAGRYAFRSTGGSGTILNQGSINATDGAYVALLGANVSNEGVISARFGTVALAAGEAITLDVAGDGLLNVAVDAGRLRALVENGGLIQAPGGQVLMTAQAAGALLDTVVNNTGVIEARTVENRDGTIRLLGDMASGTVNVAGTLDASAPNGGDGGFVETSAADVNVADGTRVTTMAAAGTTGTWLIDPQDYYIAPSGGDITGATLSANLNAGNVVIQSTTGATAGNGDIFVNDSVSWTSNFALGMNAVRDIQVNGTVGWTGTGNNGWNAGRDVLINNTITWVNNARLTLTATRNIAFNGSVTGNPGTLYLTSGGNITQTAPISVGGGPYGITSINMNGTGDVLLDNTGNNLQNVYVNGGAYNVRIYSNYAGGTPLINLPTGGTSQLGDVSIIYPNSTGLTIGSAGSYYNPFALQGNLTLTSGGSITQGTQPFVLSDPTKGTTIVAGGDVTLNTSSPNANRLNAVTVTAPATALVTLFNDSSNASLTLVNPISALILTQRNGNIALAANRVTGAMTLDVRGGTVTNNTVNLGAQTLSDKLVVYAEGGITQSGALSALAAELQAGTGGDIVLDNPGNDLGMVYVAQGRDLSLRSTYTGDATFGLPSGMRNVSIVYNNASSVGLGSNNSPTQLTGTLAVTSGGSISETGQFELTDPTKNATFTAGGDVTLNASGNLLNGVTITAPASATVALENDSATAALTLVNPVANLLLTQPNGAVTLPDHRVTNDIQIDTNGGTAGTGVTVGAMDLTGALSINADGVVTQAGPWNTVLTVGVLGQGITLGHDITTAGQGVWLDAPVTLVNDVTIDTTSMQGGGITLNQTVNGAKNLTLLTAGNAAVNLYGVVGGTTPLTSLSIQGRLVEVDAVAATDQTYRIASLNVIGPLTGSGTIQMAPMDPTASIIVGANGPQDLALTASLLDHIQPGFASLVIGGADNAGQIVFGDGPGGLAGYTFNTNLLLRNTGAGSGGIAVNDVIGATSGHNVTLATTGAFTSSVGPGAFAVSGGGYWRVYSKDPALDTRNGLVYDFKQYDTAYGGTILGTGNGLIYTRAPTLTAGLTGTVTKQYDGTTIANLAAANITAVSGLIDGDTATTRASITGSYDNKNAGTGRNVTVSGTGSDVWTVRNGSAPVYGYRLTPMTAAVGTITKAPLTVTANNDSKQYDAIPYSGGAGVTYSGFVAGETSSVLGGTLTYGGTSQGAVNVGNYSIIPGGLTSGNYAFTWVNGTLSIVERPLTLINGTLVGTVTRAYDGTMVATLTPANYQLTGWIGSDGATVTETVGTYSQANVGSNLLVTVDLTRSDYQPTGTTDLLNYSLPTSISGDVGSITRAPLTVTANNFSRAYTGLPYSGGNGVTYSGFVHGETASVLGGTLAYGGTSQGATNVGAYLITPSGLTSGNYAISFANGALDITKAPLTVTANNFSRAYTGLPYSGGNGVVYSGFVNGESESVLGGTLAYGGTSQGATNVGAYLITPSGYTSSNYAISFANGALNITPAPLSVTANNFSRAYTGLAYSGGNGVVYSGFVNGETASVLGGSLSYAGSSQGAINAGTYVITPAGLTSGNYTITFANGALDISKVPLTVTANDFSRLYNGLPYSGGNGVTYSGFVHSETASVLGGTLSYAGTSQGAKNVGSYVITPLGLTAQNYALTYVNGALQINPAPLTVTASNFSRPYTGLPYSGGNGVVYSGFVNGETSSVLGGSLAYGGSSQGAINAGSYVIAPSGLTSSNYAISFANGALDITRAPLTVTASGFSRAYSGLPYSGGNGVTYVGFVNGETASVLGGTLTYGGSSQGATNVGSYVITPAGLTSGNYQIAYANGALTITRAPLTITANNDTKVFDGTAYSGGNGVTYLGFVNNETSAVLAGTLTYGGTSQGAINVGDYSIIPAGLTSGNYAITFVNGMLSIVERPLTLISGSLVGSVTRAYDGTMVATLTPANYQLTGWAPGDGATVTETVGTFAQADVGSNLLVTVALTRSDYQPIGSTDLLNYSLPSSLSGNIGSITPRPITVTAVDQSRTYGAVNPATGAVTVTSGSLVGSDALGTASVSSTAIATTPAGTAAPLTPSAQSFTHGLASNYAVSYANGLLHITQAPLTVTASDFSRAYTGLPYSGGNGVTYSGFVNGETASVLGGSLSYGGTSQGATNVGTYVLTPQGLTSGNYAITYANGALTITRAPLTVTANGYTRAYDSTAYGGGNGVTYSGFVNGETASVLGGSLSYSGTSQGAVNAGAYVITPAGLTAGNYTISYANGALTISPRAITVAANDQNRTYGGANPTTGAVHVTSGSLAGTDALGTASVSSTATAATAAGTAAPLTPSAQTFTSGLAGNYAVTYTNGVLTITPAPLTVTANNDTRTFDGIAYGGGNGVTYSGFVNGETAAVLGGTLAYGGTSQGAVNAGAYGITPQGLTAGNYTISYANGTLTISPRPITVTASAQSRVYGNSNPVTGAVSLTSGTLVGTDALGAATVSSTATSTTAAGTVAPLTPSAQTFSSGLASNYAVSYANGTLTITPRPITVRANDTSRYYGDVNPASGTVTLTAGTLANSDALGSASLSSPALATTAAGSTSPLTPSNQTFSSGSAGNYAIAYTNGTLTITPAPLTVTANGDTRTYSGAAYSGGNGVTFSGFRNGETSSVLGGTLSYAGTSQGAVNAGTYAITPQGLTAGNYAISYVNGSLVINRAPLTVTASDFSRVYDGTAYSGGNGASYSGFVNGETPAVLGGTLAYGGSSQGAVDAGTYVITPQGLTAGNYLITYANGSLSITQRPITVQANDATRTYGATNPASGAVTLTSGSLASGDALGTATLSSTAAATTGAGTAAPLTPSNQTFTTGRAGNYAITYADGVLTITPAPLTVTANDDERVYDGQPYSGGNGVTYSGFVNGETAAVLDGTLGYGGSSQGAVEVGDYVITPQGLTAGNYTITFVDGALVIVAPQSNAATDAVASAVDMLSPEFRAGDRVDPQIPAYREETELKLAVVDGGVRTP